MPSSTLLLCSIPAPVPQATSLQAVKRSSRGAPSADKQASTQPPIKLAFIPIEVPDNVYTGFEAMVVIFEAAVIDAAYSGDWVRIGAITTGESRGTIYMQL